MLAKVEIESSICLTWAHEAPEEAVVVDWCTLDCVGQGIYFATPIISKPFVQCQDRTSANH